MPKGVYQRPPSRAKPHIIRSLRAGEPIPSGEPRRYPDQRGYVRLRWRVGVVGEYVEIREHRLVMDADPDLHVHHLDHVPHNNDPSNLQLLTPEQHRQYHSRHLQKFELADAIRLYEAGLSTPQIGRRLGVSGSNVYRRLKRSGFKMRSISESQKRPLDYDLIRRLHGQGVRAERIGRMLGLPTAESVRRAFVELGLPSFPSGRPAA